MVSFFREHKSTRRAILLVMIGLFCVGAIFNTRSPSSPNLNYGKRQLDLHHLQSTYQAILAQSPEINPVLLQEYLLNQEKNQIRLFEHIESIGLIPTDSKVAKKVKQVIPEGESLRSIALQQKQPPNDLLQVISDDIAKQQLTDALKKSSFIAGIDQSMHQKAFGQTRRYSIINLASLQAPSHHESYLAIYNKYRDQFTNPASYRYNYVDISVESLDISPPTQQDIDAFLQNNMQTYTDQDVSYSVTTFHPGSSSSNLTEFPQVIQQQIQTFKDKNKDIGSTSYSKQASLSSLPTDLKVVAAKLNQGESTIIQNDSILTIFTLNERHASNKLSPDKSQALQDDCYSLHKAKHLQLMLKEINDYAYTHPDSINVLASEYNLTVSQSVATAPEGPIVEALSDSDVAVNQYISEAFQVKPGTYRLIQLVSSSPTTQKSYDEALDDIKSRYISEILKPHVASELSQAQGEEIDGICEKYGLDLTKHETSEKESHPESIFTLVPTRKDPNPSNLSNNQWVQLNAIQYHDKAQVHQPTIDNLDTLQYMQSIYDQP